MLCLLCYSLMLRIRYDDSTAIYCFGKKFGVDTATEAEDLLLTAQSLDLNVIGISFHIGSGSKNPETFSNAIATAKNAFDIGTRIGFEFSLLDIGGGYPGEQNFNIGEVRLSLLRICLDIFKLKCIHESGET